MKTNTKANTNANTRKDAKAHTRKDAKAQAHKSEAPKVLKVTMALNDEHNGVELTFNEKPSKKTRETLKGLGFRWHKQKQVWYAKRTDDRLTFARAISAGDGFVENAVKAKASSKPSKAGNAKPSAEPKKPAKKDAPKVEALRDLGYSGAVRTAKGKPTKALLKALNDAEGITAEIERSWVWVYGDTKPYRESLKALGFRFSGKRKAWALMA